MGSPTNLKTKEPLPIARVAAAHIAHRFAPRPQPAPAAQGPRADTKARPWPDLGISPRSLIFALAGLALLPNLTVAALLWWPGQTGPAAQPAAAPVKVAMLANATLPDTRAPQPATPAEIAPVLTAPTKLEASAGATIDLPIALDGTDGVPARSSIAISGLPGGAKLSNGRPYGASGWNLKSDEIGDLQLSLPDASQGETRLAIELVAPHGEVLARAETLLNMSAAPEGDAEADIEPSVAALDGPADPLAAAPAIDLKPVPATGSHETEGASPGGEAVPAVAALEPKSEDTSAASAKPVSAVKPMALASSEDAAAADDADTVTPSMFVNLRERPTSSAPVLAVVPKGAKLAVMDRNRGWVQVKHPTSSQVGWIYDGSKWAPRRSRRAATAAPAEESFWTRLGRSLAGSSASEAEPN